MSVTNMHIRLLVTKFGECYRFYRETLGLEAGWGDENEGYAELKSEGFTLALFDRQIMAGVVGQGDKPSVADGQDRVALIMSVGDVDETCQELSGKGVSFVTQPHNQPEWGMRVAHFRDPDGNLLEINAALV
jgi:lactoylglutathione lyase